MKLPKTNLSLTHVGCLLGTNKPLTTLSACCKSTQINIWSKYKPVIGSYSVSRPSDWWMGQSRNCGIGRKFHTTLSDMYNSLKNGESQFWHEKPINEFRLGDFAGYDSNATPPMWDANVDGVIYNSTTSKMTYNMFKKESYQVDELSIADVWGSESFFSGVNLGVAFVSGNTLYWMTGSSLTTVAFVPNDFRGNVFTPGSKDMFVFLTQISKPGFFASTTGGGGFYPIPYGTIHKVKVIDSSSAASFQFTCVPDWDAVIPVFLFTVICNNQTGHRLNVDLSVQILANTITDTTHFSNIRTYRLGSITVEAGESKKFTYTEDAVSNPDNYLTMKLRLYGDQELLEEIYLLKQRT